MSSELSIIEQVVMQGNLAALDPLQRVTYYRRVCDSLGLNPFTRPFDYIMLNGKLTLYAKKDATEQLRKINGISIVSLETSVVDELYIVKAKAVTKDGRSDESIGVVNIGNLKGDAKANAIMKAETKAKRRVTLSISGMGWTDESEIETIPYANKVSVNMETGEIENNQINNNHVAIQINNSISKDQALELKTLLDQCDDEYKKQIEDYVSKPKIGCIENLPIGMFERIKNAMIKNGKENLEKQSGIIEVVENEEL